MKWIDLHAHLNMLDIDPETALQTATAEGVERVITIGTNPDDWPQVLQLVEEHHPRVHGTLGVHPHDAIKFDQKAEDFLLEHLDDKGIIAVAEIGLDYYYDHSPRDVQQRVFERQLEIAEEKKLPVQVHTRDAESDTKEILSKFAGRVSGVIHCFTGTQDLATHALNCGFNLSFSGIVTFKKAEELRSVVMNTPKERLHVETDAPFLTPAPHRGKKNHPAMVVHTARLVADLKGLSLEELSEQTRSNALGLFSRIAW